MFVGGLVLGESFPFTRVSMFAHLSEAKEIVVPRFLADGQARFPDRFCDFHGFDPEQWRLPRGYT